MYEYKTKVIRIVDGDTVDFDLDLGIGIHATDSGDGVHGFRCRLYGIDAPESYGVKKDSEEYKKGIAAKEHLAELIEGKDVLVRTYKDSKGARGRYLATIYVLSDEEWKRVVAHESRLAPIKSVNEMMVEDGFAVPYFGGKR